MIKCRMNLFDDTEMFTSGNRGKTVFELPDDSLVLVDNFIAKPEADEYYSRLLAETPWREYQMPMYDKVVTAPRMICWYEDKANPGADPAGLSWTPDLLALRQKVEAETQAGFNAVLLNLYRDGGDGVSWHSDREHRIGSRPTIASVTFGQMRTFRLRHKIRKDLAPVEIPLHHGALLVMSGTTNTFWEHQVAKTTRQLLPRINLTFRKVKM